LSNDLERANAKSALASRELCNPTRGAPPNARASRIITPVDDQFVVNCPYCGEDVEIYIEPDVQGTFVQDCEVCCNPWRVQVVRDAEERYVSVGRADGSE